MTIRQWQIEGVVEEIPRDRHSNKVPNSLIFLYSIASPPPGASSQQQKILILAVPTEIEPQKASLKTISDFWKRYNKLQANFQHSTPQRGISSQSNDVIQNLLLSGVEQQTAAEKPSFQSFGSLDRSSHPSPVNRSSHPSPVHSNSHSSPVDRSSHPSPVDGSSHPSPEGASIQLPPLEEVAHQQPPSGSTKLHECNTCKKRFKRRRDLPRHIITHLITKLYECNICKETFKCRRDVLQHMNTHLPTKLGECNICKKKLKCRRDLLVHIITHLITKLYECNICKERFKRQRDLSQHMYTHLPTVQTVSTDPSGSGGQGAEESSSLQSPGTLTPVLNETLASFTTGLCERSQLIAQADSSQQVADNPTPADPASQPGLPAFDGVFGNLRPFNILY